MPTEIRLYNKNDKKSNRYWVLVLKSSRAELYDEHDELMEDWSTGEVLEVFKMPSFWESRKGFGLVLNGKAFDFDVDARDLRTLQNYFDRAYVLKHPDAASKKLLKALGMIIVGGLIAGVSIYFAMEPGNGRVRYGGLIMGPVMVIYGFAKIFDYPYWRRLSEKINSDVDDNGEERESRRAPRSEDAEEPSSPPSNRYDNEDGQTKDR
jgi:hypothetical protein